MSIDLYEVLSPMGDFGAQQAPSASRVKDLNGKTIALLSNHQFRADKVLAAVAQQVKQHYPTAKIISWTEFPQLSAMGDVEASVLELTETLKRLRPDAVVSSTGA